MLLLDGVCILPRGVALSLCQQTQTATELPFEFLLNKLPQNFPAVILNCEQVKTRTSGLLRRRSTRGCLMLTTVGVGALAAGGFLATVPRGLISCNLH